MSSHQDYHFEDETSAKMGKKSPVSGESFEPGVETGPLPKWLIYVIGLGIFWAGAYLFSFSGGFRSDVFDHQPRYGAEVAVSKGPPDPKVLGKRLFSANCITCHQANGEGVAGQFPPLAGSEIVLGDATNHLIGIVLKGLQGSVQVKGQNFNNAMQAWEGQYTDEDLSAILTYIRSDWGNSAPAVSADAVRTIRAQLKDRRDQWTWPEIQQMPPKNLAQPAAGSTPPAPAKALPNNGSTPPAPAASSGASS